MLNPILCENATTAGVLWACGKNCFRPSANLICRSNFRNSRWTQRASGLIRSLRPGGAFDPKKEDADARRCVGRFRGGLTTKIHAVTGRSGRLVDFLLTARQRGDSPQGEVLLESFGPGKVGTIVADAAYASDAIRKLRAKVCIKPNPHAR